MRRFLRLLVVLAAAWAPAPAFAADTLQSGELRLVRFPGPTTTFDAPMYVVSPPGDTSRVFIVERGGRVRLVKDGILQTQPFLDLSAQVESTPSNFPAGIVSENALFSIAFAPDYATSGRLYAFFTDKGLCDPGTIECDDRLVEFRRSSNPDVADPTERTLLTIPHRDSAMHHGGTLGVGPDGLLWLPTGDGGPEDNAQDAGSLSGKVLRLDPSEPNPQPSVLALGLRNPFRSSFHPMTGDLILGDVGGADREEVDVLAAGTSGANFGWPVCEGDLDENLDPCPPDPVPNYAPPVLVYAHDQTTCNAITGGRVVRDGALPGLLGRYLYGEHCRSLVRSAMVVSSSSAATGDADTGLRVSHVSAFGEDANCAVYLVSLDGPVYRLESIDPGAPAHRCGPLPPGDSSPAGAAPLGSVAGQPPDRIRPALRAVSLSRRRFGVSRAVLRAALPRGATFRFTLSEPSTLTIRIYRALPGRRVGRRCLPPGPGRRGRRCVRYLLAGSLVRRLGGGRRSVPFSGRLRGRALRPGPYRATLRARDAAGNVSAGRAVSFTILAG